MVPFGFQHVFQFARVCPQITMKVDVLWYMPQDVQSPCRVHEWAMMSPMPIARALWRHFEKLDGARAAEDFGLMHPLWPYAVMR